MSAHTPGPWPFVLPCNGNGSMSESNDMGGFRAPDGSFVCHFGDDTQYYPSCGTPPKEEDGRLITAAPAMKNALDEVWLWLESTGHVMGLSELVEDALKQARGEA